MERHWDSVRSMSSHAVLRALLSVLLRRLSPVVASLLLLLAAAVLPAQPPDQLPAPLVKLWAIPKAAQFDANGHLDVDKATRAYLDTIPADKQAASNEYFEGKYWLTLWDACYSIAVMLILLFSGLARRMRDLALKLTRFRWLQGWLYFAEFFVLTMIAQSPLTWYEGFYREHIYNQSHQALGGWLRDQAIGAGVSLLLGGIVVATLYVLIRKLPGTWHLWGTAVAICFMTLIVIIAPVYIEPMFNTYTPLQNPEVTAPILRMAHANGIPVDKITEVDASKQTTQVSANVSGLFGTTRITLNDNLLRETSLEEIEDTCGHEMGHYVLHHSLKMLGQLAILVFLVFTLLRVWITGMQSRWGSRWSTGGIEDFAMFPAVVMALTVIGLLLTPILNTMTRSQEYEADLYGLNAAREPDGSAQVDVKLGQYRKMEPGPIEEFLFFDHPSGYTRIHAAMLWKSENARTIKDCPGY